MNQSALGVTDVVLRDAHQSLLATRMRIDDMLPIAEKLDQVGFWSLESWGGATFDACVRYLGEDPWQRIRLLKEAMPNTPQQMLLRGQMAKVLPLNFNLGFWLGRYFGKPRSAYLSE